ncbi:MAG: M48 family metallopeptidase [Campylobacteraceae bacterium]|jgi:Zn-dependent protease with chaperone function|nr:M48 family metallopeptidase [Campylobacteraceae bacterium]
MQSFNVHYFDGKSSSPKNVTLELHDNFIHITKLNLSYEFRDIKIRAKLKNTPQTVSFADGSYCELEASDFFSLPNSREDKFILKIESKIKYAFMSFIVLVLFVAFYLTYGSAMLANILSPQIPKNIVENISKQTLEFLDEHYMSESKLDKKRQDAIQKQFDKFLNENSDFKLHFRASEFFGANAFALPNGDIVLFDDLIELEEDAEFRGIIGILAHEKGHVVYMHGLKLLIKSSVSSALIGYLLGDFSGLVTAFSTALIDAKYSRENENAADSYAIESMKHNNISTKYVTNMFTAIVKNNDLQDKTDYKTREYSILDSHPLIFERIEKFRKNGE